MNAFRRISVALALLGAACTVASETPALRASSDRANDAKNANDKMWASVEPCLEEDRPRLDCTEKWRDEELCNGTTPGLPRCNRISKCTWHCASSPGAVPRSKFMCKKPINKLKRMSHQRACGEMGRFNAPYFCREQGEVCCTPTNADVSGRNDIWGGCIRDDGEEGGEQMTREEFMAEA